MNDTVTIFDVASYFLSKSGCDSLPVTKLHRLCYYAQAWHLAWEGEPLFGEDFEAWLFGPICPELREWHRGSFKVSECLEGDSTKFTKSQQESIDSVWDFYGHRKSYWLTQLSLQEGPWQNARPNWYSKVEGPVIKKSDLAVYYRNL